MTFIGQATQEAAERWRLRLGSSLTIVVDDRMTVVSENGRGAAVNRERDIQGGVLIPTDSVLLALGTAVRGL